MNTDISNIKNVDMLVKIALEQLKDLKLTGEEEKLYASLIRLGYNYGKKENK